MFSQSTPFLHPHTLHQHSARYSSSSTHTTSCTDMGSNSGGSSLKLPRINVDRFKAMPPSSDCSLSRVASIARSCNPKRRRAESKAKVPTRHNRTKTAGEKPPGEKRPGSRRSDAARARKPELFARVAREYYCSQVKLPLDALGLWPQ